MNRLDTAERANILALLCEGIGINAVCRVSDASKMTVLKLLADAGQACADYMDVNIRDLKSKRIECDEIWSFCYAKLTGQRRDYTKTTGGRSWNSTDTGFRNGKRCSSYFCGYGKADWESIQHFL